MKVGPNSVFYTAPVKLKSGKCIRWFAQPVNGFKNFKYGYRTLDSCKSVFDWYQNKRKTTMEKPLVNPRPLHSATKTVSIYVDGSRNGDATMASWAFVAIDNGTIIAERNGVLTGDITQMYQVGGEMQAVIEALEYCKENNFVCDIYYDYIGLSQWVQDIGGGKAWQTKNKWSKNYRASVLENKDYLNKMIKVKSHSNNEFNDYADELANLAIKNFNH